MAARATILVTGFGPFPGVARNPSADLVEAIGAGRIRAPAGATMIAEILPTCWEAVAARIPELWAEHGPDLAVHFGLHQRARGFHIEQMARNRLKSLPDVEGREPDRLHVVAGGPAILRCPVPAQKIAARLRALGLPAAVSRDAGGYLCNMAYYLSLAATDDMHRPQSALFVHIPPPATLRRRDDLECGARVILRAAHTMFRRVDAAVGLPGAPSGTALAGDRMDQKGT